MTTAERLRGWLIDPAGESNPNLIAKTADELEAMTRERDGLRTALQLVLDQVDFTENNCRLNDMVGAVLDSKVIELAHKALKGSK